MNETLILKPDADGMARAARLLAAGDLVAFPTETVYGLGADARNGRAVAGIYAAKGRPSFNPLIVHVPSTEAGFELIDPAPALRDLAHAFWPGPLTIVAPMRAGAGLSELVSAGLPTVAVRVPSSPVALALLQAFGGPVAAPSANPSGRISPTTAAHVLDGLEGAVAAVMDGGPCGVGLESTIIGLRDGQPVLLRPGGLPSEVIARALGVELQSPEAGHIEAPGQLLSHYAPNAGLRLNAAQPQQGEAYLAFGNGAQFEHMLDLSASGDLREAASNLFAHLRALDGLVQAQNLRGIAAAPVPKTGLGLAINDRLQRAAAPR